VKLLALDTATEACSVAVHVDGQVLTDYIELERGAAARILPMIDGLLARAALTLGSLDGIAVGRGPGGFTGVRLGVSVAQGLAFGARLPACGISNLAAVAQRALDLHATVDGVLVCNDARMGEVYFGAYRRGNDGLTELVGEEIVVSPQFAAPPASGLSSGWVGAGRGFRAHPALTAGLASHLVACEPDLLPRAEEIASLAVAAFVRGEAVAAADLLPVYLRDNVAQVARG